MNEQLANLRREARAIYFDSLASLDPGEALRRDLTLEAGERLRVAGADFAALSSFDRIYAVALGKAAPKMALALDAMLGSRLNAGVLSAPAVPPTNAAHDHDEASAALAGATVKAPGSPDTHLNLSTCWQAFAGGHPTPNAASLAAGRAASQLVRAADDVRSLVIYLVSGGGSACLEWPRDARVSLADLRAMNDALVTCGAGIAEINAVRRAASAVKGGGLAALAPHATQLTLIVSDTSEGEEHNVASGPSLFPPESAGPDAMEVIARYDLKARLPATVMRAVEGGAPPAKTNASGARLHRVLLDNHAAVESAADSARARSFYVEEAWDLNEQRVEQGAASLVARAFELRRRAPAATTVCLVSGGEFACPVRGRGVGGRNAETALRCAFELESRAEAGAVVCLSAGTDGIDGNSPAAGAVADSETISRAGAAGLDARLHLDASDAHTFFRALGDDLTTGPTGTNVRDLRLVFID